jgi:hypothetical protein
VIAMIAEHRFEFWETRKVLETIVLVVVALVGWIAGLHGIQKFQF